MNLSDLLVFTTVVNEGGIGKAARKLHRVPSNVTMRIRQLEAYVGTELFYRRKQRLHLSANGEVLLGYAEQLLRLSAEAQEAVSGNLPQGTLRIGALESTSASRLPEVLAGFHRRYPDVRIELTTNTNDGLIEAISRRSIDAAFAAEAPALPGISHIPVFQERLVVISNVDREPIQKASDAVGETLIVFPMGCAYRRILQRWLGMESLVAVRVLELSSYHAIVACVASGTGIALVPESVLDTMPHAMVRKHFLPRVLGNLITPLVWRSGEISPALAALRTLVERRARR